MTREQIEAARKMVVSGFPVGYWTRGALDALDALVEAAKAAQPAKSSEGDWYCPNCNVYLDGRDVTSRETHDERAGGCGYGVVVRVEPARAAQPESLVGRRVRMKTNPKAEGYRITGERTVYKIERFCESMSLYAKTNSAERTDFELIEPTGEKGGDAE